MSDPRPAAPLGPSEHLDLDALADALAGELTDDRHLSTCSSCRSRLAELAAAEPEVLGALAALPALSLPDGLPDRLQEQLRTQAAPATGATPAGASSVRRLTSRHVRWLPAAAAALVLVLAGSLGWTALRGVGTGGSADTASSAGSSESGADSSAGGLGDSRPDAGGSRTAQDPTAAVAAAPPASGSGADYADPDARSRAVALALQAASSAPSSAAAVPRSAGDRLREPAALATCLAALPPAPPPVALDHARFGARPALAVLQAAPAPGRLVLTVVGDQCGAAGPDVLLRTTVTDPG